MTRHQELPPNPARLIEGLRDTGYDFNTALADIIDNSVDAGATVIDVRIEMDAAGDVVVSITDNGSGMDEERLLDGMRYGATAVPDPRRLGKFGLGLKTASTAFCTRLSVVSRPSGDVPALKATWDLKHVSDTGRWDLILDDPTGDELERLDAVAPGRSGTLVLWEDVDRLLKQYAVDGGAAARNALRKVVERFREHAAMVYQRFLDPGDERARNIELRLNGSPVAAWNPFCEGVSTLVAGDEQDVEMADGSEAPFKIRAFVLPRKEEFPNEAAWREARLSNANQGIYIYRENRLIHPADWLGMFKQEPHSTLLRVEFSFDHRLDEAFQVDIKKSRILLNDVLYNWVADQFLPAPRNAAQARYRKGQREKVQEQAKDAHAGSNRNISDKEDDLKLATVEIRNAATNEVDLTNKKGTIRLKLKLSTATSPGQVNVQPVDGLDDGLLWEPALVNMHHAVRINTGHPYYSKVYVPNLLSGVTVQGLDSLLWALVEAELGTINQATQNHFKELRFEVSRLLRRLVEDLPEPVLEDDAEVDAAQT